MSAKNVDNHNRLRSKIVAFRMSPEEAETLDRFVKLSGLNKQDYLISRVLQKDVVVKGSSRIYKALTEQMVLLHDELKAIQAGEGDLKHDLLDVIEFTAKIVKEMNNC